VVLQAAGALEGVVKPAMPGAELPDNLHVRLEWQDGTTDRLSAQVDGAGRFERDGLLPGRWRCELRNSALSSSAPPLATKEVVIVVGETAELEIPLPP